MSKTVTLYQLINNPNFSFSFLSWFFFLVWEKEVERQLSIYIYIYMYIYMFVCEYIYTYNCIFGFGVHVKNMQYCCIGTYMAMWFAAFLPITLYLAFLPMLSLPNSLPHTVPPLVPSHRPQCVMLPALCPCALIVQHLPISENMRCLIFCSCVSLLRMMVSRFIHVPTKDTNSSFLIAACIPWCICATFSQSSLSLMGIWVGSRSLLL